MSKGDDLDRLINSTDALLVYFFSDRCPPCISLRPKVGQLMAEEFPKMKLVLVNSELYPELAASHKVFSLPVIMIFFEGKEFLRFSKYVSLTELKESIGRIYQLYYA